MTATHFVMHNGRGSDDGCPDAELLASYIDGRATPAERARVEAHLARCEDCYFVFTETFQEPGVQAGLPAAADVNRNPFRGKIIRRAAAGLAAAAAVVVAVQVYRTGTPQGSTLVAALQELDAAAGPNRTYEGRLTTAPTYRPVAAPVRSGLSNVDAPLSLRDAALKVETAAQKGQTPDERRALSAVYLTRGQPQRAADIIAPLADTTTDPAMLNDTAVALLARKGEGDAKRAQTLLQRAIEREPKRAEAWFNLGLAAEAAGDTKLARVAWQQYLTLDSSSQWAVEVRGRLEKLDPDDPSRRRMQMRKLDNSPRGR